jgi:hypothetical protein
MRIKLKYLQKGILMNDTYLKPGALSITIILIAIAIFLLFSNCSEEKKPVKEKSQSTEINPQKLAGSWLRPDGGYVLELSNVNIDGRVDAAYYNPNPINVAESKWLWHETRLQVYIKFEDVNYPRSTYTLEYFSSHDRLIGNYYQAVMGQNYSVEFVRKD